LLAGGADLADDQGHALDRRHHLGHGFTGAVVRSGQPAMRPAILRHLANAGPPKIR
jgi:hypothetical protein